MAFVSAYSGFYMGNIRMKGFHMGVADITDLRM
jgi:hypothetical protein